MHHSVRVSISEGLPPIVPISGCVQYIMSYALPWLGGLEVSLLASGSLLAKSVTVT